MPYLYVIQCQGYSKIGIANSVEARMAQLQTGNPYPLLLTDCYEFPNAGPIEQSLHQRFAAKSHALEWFNLGSEDRLFGILG
jgi:hypothetical protein